MKNILKRILIVLFAAVAAVCCFTAFGCTGNPDNGGGPDKSEKPEEKPDEKPGTDDKFVDYTLDGFLCTVTGQDDIYVDINNMSETDRATYEAVILMYGKQVKISPNKIKFVDGTTFISFGEIAYTLNGDNVLLSEEVLSTAFNYIKLNDGVFSIGVQQSVMGTTIAYSFDYYAAGVTAPSYTVNFETFGGGVIEPQTVKKGSTVQAPEPPEKKGYTFVGWHTDENFTKPYNFSGKVFKNITLYAKWNPLVNTVSFQTFGGTVIKNQLVYSGEAVKMPASPNKNGHDFAGWYKDDALTEPWDFNELIYEDVTLYAKYSPATCTIKFNALGGSCATSSKNVVWGTEVGALPVPEREKFTFDGWYDDPDGGKKYTESTFYYASDEATFYAKWLTEITLDNDGVGTLPQEKLAAAYGWKQYNVESLPSLTCDGAEFLGWYTEAGAKGDRYTDFSRFEFDGPFTLYAGWKLTVTYHGEGGNSPAPSTVIKGNSFTPKAPERTGYTFAGWRTLPDNGGERVDETTVINYLSSFDLYASWTANEIKFNFDVQGGEPVSSRKYSYDSPLGELPVPEKCGNVFGGWFTQTAGAGTRYTAETVCKTTAEVTLYAKWTANVIFEYGGATSGNSLEKINFTYLTKISITLPQPYKEGRSFEGWFSEENGAGSMLTNTGITDPDTKIWNLEGDTRFYAYWVKGTDKRFLNYTEDGNVVKINGLKDDTVTQLEIPAVINFKSVTEVTGGAFSGKELVSAIVPETVQSIGNGVFRDCPLVEITVPFVGGGLGAYNENAVFGHIFGRTEKTSTDAVEGAVLQYVHGSWRYWYFVPQTLEKVTVTGMRVLPQNAFGNCAMLKEVNLPGGVHTVGPYAFKGCSQLITLNGIENPVNVSDYAFYGCEKLTDFPVKSLNTVGAYSFYNCVNLSEINFDEKLTEIKDGAFDGCVNLREVKFNAALKTIGSLSFHNTGLVSVTVPDSVESIGNGAFMGCPLVEITVPFVGGGLDAYNENAVFGHIFGRTEKTSTDAVEGAVLQYEHGSWRYWYHVPQTLEKVTVTNMSMLQQNVFVNCTMIKELNFRGNVTVINENALGCANLEILRFNCAVPATVKIQEKLSKTVTIIVPEEYLEDYKAVFEGYNVISE